MNTRLFRALCGLVVVHFTVAANAALQPRLGGQAVYDTDLAITWLADAGGAGSPRGLMTWLEAQNWAAGFSLNGATEWRLPATIQPDASCKDPASSSGLNCTGSEMGHLFYLELSGIGGEPIASSTDPDLALFLNIEGANWWSGTSFTIPEFAWDFRFGSGLQSAHNKEKFSFFAWAVHDGDVFAPDTDKDGVADPEDNCINDANASQHDTDSDGFGNLCDGDFNQDCAQNFVDLGVMKQQFFWPGDLNTDMNGDGSTNFLDLARMKQIIFLPPGPSGVLNNCNRGG